jgi:predicted RNA-binding protein with RPS1 domain/MFS family permease
VTAAAVESTPYRAWPNKRAIWSWSLYDFANSSFTTLIVTFVYATYFTQAIADDPIGGTELWSRGVTITALVVALFSPVLGAIADRGGYRKLFVVLATLICVVATAALYTVMPGQVVAALVLVVIANIAYELGTVFYNAFLPDLAPPGRIGTVSGLAWGLGYIGGLLALAFALLTLVQPEVPWFGFSTEGGENIRATNLVVAAWFLVFSVPLLLWVPEDQAIVRYRDENGPFATRKALLKVPRFGAKAFEQAAGFLRIRGASDPLDNTAVHPERYPLVKAMAADLGTSVTTLAKDAALVAQIDLKRYVTADVGLPTLRDIVEELKKPGRDPRASFQMATFRDDVKEISDLHEGMFLEGVVTNVTAFGAFVDVGVHQDGLVHVSHLGHRFIRDPNEAVKVGQIVKVKVLSVDAQRKRIALSIKEASPVPANISSPPPQRPREKETKPAAPSWEKAGFRVKK